MQNFKTLIFLLAVNFLFQSNTQAQDKYRELKWEAPDIKAFIDMPGLEKVVFNFTRNSNGNRATVTGFDRDGKLLSRSGLSSYGRKRPEFTNVYPLGLFFLEASELKSFSAQGTKTIYFVPKKYESAPGTVMDYVMYIMYDGPPDELPAVPLLTKPLNPSPPASR